MLEALAPCKRFSVRFDAEGFFVDSESDLRQTGQQPYAHARSFLSNAGQTAKVIILVDVKGDGFAVAV